MTCKRLVLIVLFATPSACSDPAKVDIGDPIGANLADYAGNWDGYAEAYTFGSSDRVRLMMDASGQGTIRFGDSPLLPPPTDPALSYPAPFTDPAFVYPTGLRDDVQYPLHDLTLTASRIRFGVDLFDLYGAWCEMQTPVPGTSVGYTCDNDMIPVGTTMDEGTDTCHVTYPDGSVETQNCGHSVLCVGWDVCDCTASGCTARQRPDETKTAPAVEYDGALEGDGSRWVGTLLLNPTTRVTVRLERN
jgi:hypothetical protein